MSDQNPFAPPQTEQAPASLAETVAIDQAMIRRFHAEIMGLAGFWICMGLVGAALGYALASDPTAISSTAPKSVQVLFGFLGFAMTLLGTTFVLLGVLTGFKFLRAVKLALRLSYVTLLLPPVWVTIVGALVVGLAIVQTHRVLRWAEQLQLANLPLNIRPHQVLAYRTKDLHDGKDTA